MNNSVLIVNEYGTEVFSNKEVPSFDETQNTVEASSNTHELMDYVNDITASPVFLSVVCAIALMVIITVIKRLCKPALEEFEAISMPDIAESVQNDAVISVEKYEKTKNVSFATPNTLNKCIRLFLEITRNK